MTFNKVYSTQDAIELINKAFGKYMVENIDTFIEDDPRFAIEMYDYILNEFRNAEKGSEADAK